MCHPKEFAFEVDARDFLGCHFADAKAAHCANEEHQLVGIGRNIDDSRGGVGVSQKSRCSVHSPLK